MSEMEDKLGAVLGNPEMMQKIMSMAQSLTQTQTQTQQTEPPQVQKPPQRSLPQNSGMDPAMLQRIFSVAQQTNIDKNQQSLLRSLGPYLTRDRLTKLEKAMRAAKIAAIAAAALGSGRIMNGR